MMKSLPKGKVKGEYPPYLKIKGMYLGVDFIDELVKKAKEPQMKLALCVISRTLDSAFKSCLTVEDILRAEDKEIKKILKPAFEFIRENLR